MTTAAASESGAVTVPASGHPTAGAHNTIEGATPPSPDAWLAVLIVVLPFAVGGVGRFLRGNPGDFVAWSDNLVLVWLFAPAAFVWAVGRPLSRLFRSALIVFACGLGVGVFMGVVWWATRPDVVLAVSLEWWVLADLFMATVAVVFVVASSIGNGLTIRFSSKEGSRIDHFNRWVGERRYRLVVFFSLLVPFVPGLLMGAMFFGGASEVGNSASGSAAIAASFMTVTSWATAAVYIERRLISRADLAIVIVSGVIVWSVAFVWPGVPRLVWPLVSMAWFLFLTYWRVWQPDAIGRHTSNGPAEPPE